MNHATQTTDATQRVDGFLERPACMHDHRQVVLLRDMQLPLEQRTLPCRIESFHVEVEPDFPDGYGSLAIQPRGKFVHVGIMMPSRK